MATLHAHIITPAQDVHSNQEVALTVVDLDGKVGVALKGADGFGHASVMLTTDEARALVLDLQGSLSTIDNQVFLARQHEHFVQVQARLAAQRKN